MDRWENMGINEGVEKNIIRKDVFIGGMEIDLSKLL